MMMTGVRKQRDLPVTIYRVLLYLSRMRVEESDAKRLVRIERATGIDRKDLKTLLNRLTERELIEEFDSGKRGRGGHPIVHWEITEAGRMWRSDIGRFIQFGERLGYYPSGFFYLPSDAY